MIELFMLLTATMLLGFTSGVLLMAQLWDHYKHLNILTFKIAQFFKDACQKIKGVFVKSD